MATVNEKFADKINARALRISRLESGTAKAAIREFKKLEESIIADLQRIDPTPSRTARRRKARLSELLASVKATIASHIEKIKEEVKEDLNDIAIDEVKFVNTTTAAAVKTDAFWITYSNEQISRTVDNTLIQGAPSKEWWSRQEIDAQNRFKDVIRQGMLRGESVQQITRRVRESLQINRRNAETLARTSVQTVANQVRQDIYNESEVVKGVQWRSTLDSRTSTICMALDGLMWSLPDYKPIGHSISFPGPTAHWNCRSTQTAVLKSWEELGVKDQGKIPEGTRSSMDGQVSGAMNYEDWLRTKNEAFQREMLGPTKHKMWKDGKLSFRELVNEDARPLRIKELKDGTG